jgi:O-antigen/teichoic acid export membrane protein
MLRLTATQVLAGGAPALSAAPERIGRDGLALALLGAAAAIGVSLTAVEAMALLAAGLVLALMAALLARTKVFAGDPRPATALYRRREWIGAVAAFAALGGLQMLVHRLDVILLGWLAGTTAAGLYWIAVAISEIATLPMLALGSVTAPAIAALYARDDLAAKRATMRSATVRMVAGTCLFAAPLFVLAPWLLGAFGARFIEATDALRILLLGQFLRALAGPVLAMLALTGNERVATAILAAAAICDAILCVVLIPRYGLTGAATASLAVWAGSHLVMTVLVWRRFGYVPLFASHAP